MTGIGGSPGKGVGSNGGHFADAARAAERMAVSGQGLLFRGGAGFSPHAVPVRKCGATSYLNLFVGKRTLDGGPLQHSILECGVVR